MPLLEITQVSPKWQIAIGELGLIINAIIDEMTAPGSTMIDSGLTIETAALDDETKRKETNRLLEGVARARGTRVSVFFEPVEPDPESKTSRWRMYVDKIIINP